MENDSEDANPQIEFLVKSYIWPLTDLNMKLKAQREHDEQELAKLREDEMRKKVDIDTNVQKNKLLKQQEAKKMQEKQQEEEKRRKEEEEQRSKLEGRLELMIDNLQKNNTPQEYTLAGLALNSVRLRLVVNNAKKNNTLLGLHLARMKITGNDVKVLCELLDNNTTLQKLELEGNEIEPASTTSQIQTLTPSVSCCRRNGVVTIFGLERTGISM